MATIRIDYQRAVNKSNQIKDLAAEMKKVSAGIDGLIATANSTWQGAAKNSYVAGCQRLQEKVLASSAAMNSLADKIKYAADEINRADERSKTYLA